MEKQNYNSYKIILAIIYIYFLAGIVWHLIPATKEIVLPLTSYGLYVFSILLLFIERKNFSLISILWFVFIVVTTFFIEVLGVKTGNIFGEYNYSNVLGIKLLQVPIIIALNWGFVLLGIYSLVINTKISSNVLKVVLISILTVIFDIMLEPIAIKLNYWNWHASSVPLQNYLAWYLIAFCFSTIGVVFKISIKTKLISHYIYAQAIFFTILNVFL